MSGSRGECNRCFSNTMLGEQDSLTGRMEE